mmetsp:Transcript_22677/g.47767  ORF Transcript_22677/g.47767 Transcript_22677/m.47767 type:complete len:748 (-) Transcript_22677:117-2360(-)
MSEFVGTNDSMRIASSGCGMSSPSRPTTAYPRSERRVIFPSLHGSVAPSRLKPAPRSLRSGPRPQLFSDEVRSSSDDKNESPRTGSSVLETSPTDVRAVMDNASFKPFLSRANSLDGISIPLPRLSNAPEDWCGKANDAGVTPLPRPLSQRNKAQDDGNLSSIYPSPGRRGSAPLIMPKPAVAPRRTQSQGTARISRDSVESGLSKSNTIFGDATLRRRTYYPAATVPIPVTSDRKTTPSPQKPLLSILRKKATAPRSPSALSRQSSKRYNGTATSSYESSPTETISQASSASQLSPSPTLASPASIKSLQERGTHHRNEGDIGESEYNIEHMSDSPKVLPREERTLRRNQSDTIVSKAESAADSPEGSMRSSARRHSASSSPSRESSVSRHASLECLPHNRRISFDPHITVYEFGISEYEQRRGEKWFTEDQLMQFKREAMQRIRLRSSIKVIPTGTGRALTVTGGSKGGGRGRCGPSTSADDEGADTRRGKMRGNGTKSSKGGNGSAVSFNHPALGCDDEFDAECQSGSQSTNMMEGNRVGTRQDDVRATAAHIRNILVVDCHEIFLALFTKGLKHMVPHASIATARSPEEAISRIEAARRAFPLSDGGCIHGFDIIIVEERLQRSLHDSVQQLAGGERSASTTLQTAGDDSAQRRWDGASGSALIRHLVESERGVRNIRNGEGKSSLSPIRESLLVGVSAKLLLEKDKLEKSGADVVWGKPPPEMNTNLRNELVRLLIKKRSGR